MGYTFVVLKPEVINGFPYLCTGERPPPMQRNDRVKTINSVYKINLDFTHATTREFSSRLHPVF